MATAKGIASELVGHNLNCLDSEARRHWHGFEMIAVLPERDQKTVIRLINA